MLIQCTVKDVPMITLPPSPSIHQPSSLSQHIEFFDSIRVHSSFTLFRFNMRCSSRPRTGEHNHSKTTGCWEESFHGTISVIRPELWVLVVVRRGFQDLVLLQLGYTRSVHVFRVKNWFLYEESCCSKCRRIAIVSRDSQGGLGAAEPAGRSLWTAGSESEKDAASDLEYNLILFIYAHRAPHGLTE